MPMQNESEMRNRPRVLLLGDSIRGSYQPLVAKLMADRAEVVGPDENGRFAAYTHSRLAGWLAELGHPDIVHWNNGLWDCGHWCEREPKQIPLDEYVATLRQILDDLRALTRSIIWATSDDGRVNGVMVYSNTLRHEQIFPITPPLQNCRMPRRHTILIIVAAALLCCTGADSAPRFVYLTWQGDTSTTVTVYYHTDAAADDSAVRYDEQPRGGRIDDYAFTEHGGRHQIEGLADGRTIHVVELSGLKPAATYYFVAGDLENGFSNEHSFRTIPNDGQPIRFVVGGDMGILPDVGELMARAGATDPMFAIVGGDITYSNGDVVNVGRWDQWLEFWQRHMRTPDGHDIPIVAAIGNHEVHGGFEQPREHAPFYTGYLAQNRDRTYFTMQFGPNLTLFVLDSGHVARHDGAQAEWLETELQRYRHVPNRVAAYHVPLYPTARPFHYEFSVRGRTHWAPLFDRYGLTAAFEHHDHAFKRTWPIRNGRRDPSGTVYLGAGCFGMPHRPLTEGPQWYQAKAAPLQHFWSVEVAGDQIHCRAISKAGDVFDVYPPDTPDAAEAEQMWAVLAWPELIDEVIPEQAANHRIDSTISWTLPEIASMFILAGASMPAAATMRLCTHRSCSSAVRLWSKRLGMSRPRQWTAPCRRSPQRHRT